MGEMLAVMAIGGGILVVLVAIVTEALRNMSRLEFLILKDTAIAEVGGAEQRLELLP